MSDKVGVNPWTEPPEDVFTWTKSPNEAPDAPAYVEIGFEKDIPVTIRSRDYH